MTYSSFELGSRKRRPPRLGRVFSLIKKIERAAQNFHNRFFAKSHAHQTRFGVFDESDVRF